MVRYAVAGPFRVIVGVAGAAGAVPGNFGTGWPEPATLGGWDLLVAVEPRVLLVEDLPQWPDEQGGPEARRVGRHAPPDVLSRRLRRSTG